MDLIVVGDSQIEMLKYGGSYLGKNGHDGGDEIDDGRLWKGSVWDKRYSDTLTQSLVAMEFTEIKAEPGKTHRYRVIAVNTVGLSVQKGVSNPLDVS